MQWTAWVVLAGVLASPPEPVDFERDVVPLLTKSGCNSGACHGAAAGRGGLQLSLLGMNPQWDYEQIVHHWEGRRINLARPEASLLLKKPTEQLAHGGGTRFLWDSPEANMLMDWIAAGAPTAATAPLAHLEVQPPDVLLEGEDRPVDLTVQAHFTDGTVRDVTRLTTMTAEDTSALHVQQGRIHVLRPGQHTLVLRYMNRVVPVRFRRPWSDPPVDLGDEPRWNYVDDYILDTLGALHIPPSGMVDDAGFARRAWLDLTGRLPPPDALQRFLVEPRDDKRARLIDELMASEAFVDMWTLKLAQLFRVQSATLQTEGALAYYQWLRSSVAENRPYDRLVREMVVAEGDGYQSGPANFLRAAVGPRETGEFFSESLLGVRLRCANCHDHPLDQWTQDDYHGLAAIFARVSQGQFVRPLPRGEVTHPRTGEPAQPRIPGADRPLDAEEGREQLADWLCASDNPLLARALVNRVWKELMGRGLVEPADDLRATNPATHPELLQRLAADFVDHGYDLRHLIRCIVRSAAYCRSAKTQPENAWDDRFYSHALVRSLPAEVLADAITDVTGVSNMYGELPAGTRAVSLFDSRIASEALDVLGRCPRDGSCSAVADRGDSLPRTLHLANGPLVNDKLRDPQGRLQGMLRESLSDEEMLTQLYRRALSRLPSAREREHWLALRAESESRSAFWEDFLWALLNSREFVTNH